MMSSSESSGSEFDDAQASSHKGEAPPYSSGEPLDILCNTNILQMVIPDIEPVDEPTNPQYPDVVRIQYTESFNYVMGLYRRMRPSFEGLHAASSPRWFFLTAFALRQCTSHYTIWKDRRDVILSASRLLASTQESLLDLGHGNPDFLDVVTPAAKAWLPKRNEIIASNGEYSPWRAVLWELEAVRTCSLIYHKNFQVWHHRKEILIDALRQTEDATRAEVLKSIDAFDEILLARDKIRFVDIDERSICDEALENDSKNYHVWMHRSWFVHAFPFLVQPPSWTALLESSSSDENSDNLLLFHPIEDWGHVCTQPDLPPCPVHAELEYTASAIKSDCLNNSPWCHRFFVFDRDIIVALLRTPVNVSTDRIEAVIRRLCSAEIHYALQWSAHEPCNESPFVHARSVAKVYQSVALRLLLSADGSAVLDDAVESLLLTRPNSALAPLAERVSYEAYLRTFDLLLQHMQVLKETIVPRAEDMRSRAAARDSETVEAIHCCRSQFLLDNVHQVYAALYHGFFAILEHMWCYYFTDNDRARVHAVVPPETYDEGIDAVNKIISGLEEKDCVTFFLECEVEAALLAKHLVLEDGIRSKYWKNEVIIVLHRDYA